MDICYCNMAQARVSTHLSSTSPSFNVGIRNGLHITTVKDETVVIDQNAVRNEVVCFLEKFFGI